MMGRALMRLERGVRKWGSALPGCIQNALFLGPTPLTAEGMVQRGNERIVGREYSTSIDDVSSDDRGTVVGSKGTVEYAQQRNEYRSQVSRMRKEWAEEVARMRQKREEEEVIVRREREKVREEREEVRRRRAEVSAGMEDAHARQRMMVAEAKEARRRANLEREEVRRALRNAIREDREKELVAASAHWIANEEDLDARIDQALQNPVRLWKSRKTF